MENNEIMQNLLKEDATFSESKFKSKAENIFVQIRLAMMTGKTEKVQHFVSEDVYEKIVSKVEDDKSKGRIQMYEEQNVAGISIENIEETADCFKITIALLSRAYEYFIDRNTKKFISGNTDEREEKSVKIVFTKSKLAKTLGEARTCPSCGANIDVNRSGQCSYCGAIFNLKNYDWIITAMEYFK